MSKINGILSALLTITPFSCSDAPEKTKQGGHQREQSSFFRSDEPIQLENPTITTETREGEFPKEKQLLPPPEIKKMKLISSGQASPTTEIKLNGIAFDLVLREKDTIYLSTTSEQFKTPEGFRIGSRLSELPENIQKDFIKLPGWGYYYPLKSGWSLAFCEGNTCTDTYPSLDSKVKWVFKRPLQEKR